MGRAVVIVLECADGALCLSIDASGWCRVALSAGGATHELGAGAFDHVVRRLELALGDLPREGAAILDGVGIQWILSLAERHSSMYAGDVGSQRVLFVQGADGSLLHRLHLEARDRVRWSHALARARE